MTKTRTPGGVHDALIEIYAAIGISNAATVVGKSEAHLYRLSNPDDDCLPNIEQCAKLDAACIRSGKGAPIFSVYSRWMKAIAGEDKKKEAEPVHLSLMDVGTHFGVLNHAIRTALADAKITRAERDDILRTVAKMRRELDDLEHAVYAHGK